MIIRSGFTPPMWLRNAHLQTLWPYAARYRIRTRLHRERLELADGDFIDLDWNLAEGGPLVILLHGLSGSADSHYARSLLTALQRRGLRGVLMNFRGASGEPNRLARSYHGGETGDLTTVIELLRRREPHTPLAAVGYSLGANVLLKWLGEQEQGAALCAAVAVSVPFDLGRSTVRLMQGLSRLYQWHILRSLKRALAVKARRVELPIDLSALQGVSDFRRFDDLVTAPLHGFRNAEHYYRRSSSAGYLRAIGVPTLIVHALDDPFVPPAAVPDRSALSPTIVLELSRYGGHVGFVSHAAPSGYGWLDGRILEFLRTRLPLGPAAGAPGG